MRIRTLAILLLLSVLTVLPEIVSGQEDSKARSRIKCEYIWNFGRNLKWGDSLDDVDSFHVAFICPDSTLYSYFTSQIGWRRMKRRPIKVSLTQTLDPIPDAQLIYLDERYNSSVDLVYDQLEGKPMILLTDGCTSPRAVMINFSPEGSFRVIEANEENIEKQGIRVPGFLMALTDKQEEDWESYFTQADSALDIERALVEQQQQQLATQRSELKKIEEHILALNDDLKHKESLLHDQLHKIQNQEENLKVLQTDIAKQRMLLEEKSKILQEKDAEVAAKEQELKDKQLAIQEQNQILEEAKAEVAFQEEKIKKQRSILSNQGETIKRQENLIWIGIVFIVLIAGFAFMVFRNYRAKKRHASVLQEKNVAIQQQNEEINQQKEEILAQRDEIESQREMALIQRDEIAEVNREMVDSIQYAQRIQSAVFPPRLLMEAALPEYFVLNRPRDIVSGDFYWLKHVKGKTYLAVADCTGHGVPGAFMSMLGITSLNELINQKGALPACEMLDGLRQKIIYSLHQTGKEGESKDGMDISMIIYDEKARTLEYAGANNSLYIIREGEEERELLEFKPDKMPIGLHAGTEDKNFCSHHIPLQKGDCCYLFSDGYADQFGGPKGKKFKYKPFKELLKEVHHQSLSDQHDRLAAAIDNWRGDLEQVDDILVVGIRVA